MTFDPNVPNAAQSPGLFPPQNNVNFARIKTIINADHVFNDTTQTTDGIHRQCTMLVRAQPVSLPAGSNSILYSWIDTFGQTQLRFYNGNDDFQLTPPEQLYPIRVVGSASLTAGSSTTAYADPGFLWEGTGLAVVQNSTTMRYYNIIRSGSNYIHQIDENTGPGSRPTLQFSGNNLTITNQSGSSTLVVVWSLIINRIS